jgi:hypothetical protein
MSGPILEPPGSATLGASAPAYAWAGVVVDRRGTLSAVGVRSDDEKGRQGESVLVELLPGRHVVRQRLPFVVRAVGGTGERPLVLDERDRLWRLARTPEKIADDIVDVCGAFSRQRDGRVVRIDDDEGPRVVAEHATAIGDGLIATETDIWRVDGNDLQRVWAWAGPTPVHAGATWGPEVAVVAGLTCTVLPSGPSSTRRRMVTLPAVATCLARAPGRWLLGSPKNGLYALDDDDDDVRLVRPSLRAHQLVRTADGVVAVSRLMLSVSDDGRDWVGRDLSSIVRALHP